MGGRAARHPAPLARLTDRLVPTGRISVYVHFPFCVRHCPYCDFTVAVTAQIPHAAYADAVLDELSTRAPGRAERDLLAVYFGGGTPGLWDTRHLGRVRAAIVARLGAEPREVTVELNPEEASSHRLARLRDAGVDRLSFGVQSFDPAVLTFLGRAHEPATAVDAVETASALGFSRISIDLIHGIPDRSRASLDEDLRIATALPVDHVSAYELTVEPRTSLAARERRGGFVRRDEASMVARSRAVEATLTRSGFTRYEVSNYARPGGRSLHNSAYWVGDEYLGLGVGAHSLRIDTARRRAVRSANDRSVRRYLHADGARRPETEALDAEVHLRELVMLACRTSAGVDLEQLSARFGSGVAALAPLLEAWSARGWGIRDGPRFRPTPEGWRFADTMGAEALAF